MKTTAEDYEVSSTIDLEKIRQALINVEKPTNFIYGYDSSRIVDGPDEEGDLSNLTQHCQFFNHRQQKLGSCYLQSSISTITMAENPEDIEDMRNRRGDNVAIDINQANVDENTKFNPIELKQLYKIAEVSENLEIDRFGRKSDIEEFTNAGNRPRIIHQIINEPTREELKNNGKEFLQKEVKEYIQKKVEEYTQKREIEEKLCQRFLKSLEKLKEIKHGTYLHLLIKKKKYQKIKKKKISLHKKYIKNLARNFPELVKI